MLGVSYDEKGLKYVATIEHKKYPIYAFQYYGTSLFLNIIFKLKQDIFEYFLRKYYNFIND